MGATFEGMTTVERLSRPTMFGDHYNLACQGEYVAMGAAVAILGANPEVLRPPPFDGLAKDAIRGVSAVEGAAITRRSTGCSVLRPPSSGDLDEVGPLGFNVAGGATFPRLTASGSLSRPPLFLVGDQQTSAFQTAPVAAGATLPIVATSLFFVAPFSFGGHQRVDVRKVFAADAEGTAVLPMKSSTPVLCPPLSRFGGHHFFEALRANAVKGAAINCILRVGCLPRPSLPPTCGRVEADAHDDNVAGRGRTLPEMASRKPVVRPQPHSADHQRDDSRPFPVGEGAAKVRLSSTTPVLRPPFGNHVGEVILALNVPKSAAFTNPETTPRMLRSPFTDDLESSTTRMSLVVCNAARPILKTNRVMPRQPLAKTWSELNSSVTTVFAHLSCGLRSRFDVPDDNGATGETTQVNLARGARI